MDDFIHPALHSSSWSHLNPSLSSYRGDDNFTVQDAGIYGLHDSDFKFGIPNALFSHQEEDNNTGFSLAAQFFGSVSIESSGSQFPSSRSINSVSAMCPPPYSDVSFMKAFGFQDDAQIYNKTSPVNGRYSTLDHFLQDQNEFGNSHITNLSARQHKREQNGHDNLHLPALASGSQMISTKLAGVQARHQPTQVNSTNHSSANQSHLSQANGSAGDGAAKPRVRARRGQATDPHSIAERLRREKISERMKNLQELVPNSNKIDKASMLDEIIDYVRFLQLQVKVLSMSRLGAAGAVVPLITDGQAEHSSSLFPPPSAGKRVDDLSESEDNIAFEQEVVKLLESNVTTAMQCLQNKGLCLMPLALATAISNKKGSSASILQDRRNIDANRNVISQSSLCLIENDIEDGSSSCNGDIKNEKTPKPLGN